MCTGSDKTLMKEMKTQINAEILLSWLGRINVKVSVLPAVIYRFSTTSTEIPMALFTEVENAYWEL